MEIITRADAAKQGLTKYFTGKACPRGHVDSRWVSTHGCCTCGAEKASKWREDNKEHRQKYRAAYRKQHIEQERLDSRRHHTKHKERLSKQRKRDYDNNPVKYMIYRARDRANRLGLFFNLSEADITMPAVCPVFGFEFKVGDQDRAPSLDKIIPALGYIVGNVVVVSTKANRIKNDATVQEIELVAAFYKNLCGV